MSEHKRVRVWVPLAALSILLLAACGGGGSTAAASSPDDTANVGTANPDEVPADMQKFVDCMKQQGVEIPSGARFQRESAATEVPPSSVTSNDAPPSASIDRTKLDAAREACSDLLPEGAVFGGPGAGSRGGGVDASAFEAYRSCMSDHGVTIPERQPDQQQAPVSIDRGSDSFKAANDVCAPLLPNGGQGFATEGTNP